jgi:hypothetical protein
MLRLLVNVQFHIHLAYTLMWQIEPAIIRVYSYARGTLEYNHLTHFIIFIHAVLACCTSFRMCDKCLMYNYMIWKNGSKVLLGLLRLYQCVNAKQSYNRLFPGFSAWGVNRMTEGAGRTGTPLGVSDLGGVTSRLGDLPPNVGLEKSLNHNPHWIETEADKMT